MEIKEIYKVIDNSKFNLLEGHENKVITLFKELRSRKNDEKEVEVVKLAQLEIDIQNFQINNNILGPCLTGTDSNGNYSEYPTLKTWDDESYNYLIQRQKQTNNPVLKAKYSHILWLSPKKHLQFAKDALASYLKLIRNLNSVARDKTGNLDTHELNIYVRNAYNLAISSGVKDEIEKVKNLILNIVTKFDYNSDNSYYNIELIELMLGNPKIFKRDNFDGLEAKCLKYAESQNSRHTKIEIIKVAEKVSVKLGFKKSIFKELIADNYEKLSREREDGTNIASTIFCQDAIKYYKKLKNFTKVKELEDYYKHLKQTRKLGQFSHEFDITKIINQKQKLANEIVKEDSDFIIKFLMYSPVIFPSYDQLLLEAQQTKRKNPLTFLSATTLYDEIGHTCAHYNDENEKIHYFIMEKFGLTIGISSIFLIREIIFRAVERNKISAYSILDFLSKKSWLGQEIIITYKQGREDRFNWLKILAPGINDFFSQLWFFFQNPINTPNFVLAIDSLSIKIEGILRDICELRGHSTFFQAEDSKGRSIVKEKDINTLLREDFIKSVLSKDDIMLLQFILIDKAGWNLRNKVAHTLIREATGYNLQYILLLIIAILKLSKNEYGYNQL